MKKQEKETGRDEFFYKVQVDKGLIVEKPRPPTPEPEVEFEIVKPVYADPMPYQGDVII